MRTFSALRFSPPGLVRVQRGSSSQDQLWGTFLVNVSDRQPEETCSFRGGHEDAPTSSKPKADSSRPAFQTWATTNLAGRAQQRKRRGSGALLQRDRVWPWAPFTIAPQHSSGGSQSHHGVVGGVRTQILPANTRHALLLHRRGVQCGGHIRCH